MGDGTFTPLSTSGQALVLAAWSPEWDADRGPPEQTHLPSERWGDHPTVEREIQGADQSLEDKTITLVEGSTPSLVLK